MISKIVAVNSESLVGIVTAGDIARTLAENKGYRKPAFNAIARYKEGSEPGPYR